jgi:hypothetical protein
VGRADGCFGGMAASMVGGEPASAGIEAALTKSESLLPTRRTGMTGKHIAPIHPGEILLEEFLSTTSRFSESVSRVASSGR